MIHAIRTRSWETSWCATVIGALWLAVFPLVSKFSYAGFTRSKWVIALAMCGVSLGAALIMLLLGAWRRVGWLHSGRLVLIAFFAWTALSAVFGLSADQLDNEGRAIVWIGSGRFEGLSTQLCYLGIFLSMSLIRPKMKALMGVAAAGMTAFFTVIMLQYAGYNPLGLYPNFPDVYNMRTTYEFQGTMGQIDMVSGFLSMMTPLLLGYWVCRGGKCGWFLLPAGAMSVLLMLMIEVDGGRLALVLAAGLLVCLMLVKPETRGRGMVVLGLLLMCFTLRKLIGLPWLDGLEEPWNAAMRSDIALPSLKGDELVVFPWNPSLKKLLPALLGLLLMLGARPVAKRPGRAIKLWVVMAAGAVLAVAVVAALYFAPVPPSMGFLWEVHEILQGRVQDSFGSERIGAWRCALVFARRNLLFGHGPDTFYPVMREYVAQGGAQIHQNFDNPHSMYLAILMQNGLPALLLYLGGMVCVVVRAARSPEGKAVAAAAVCYLFHGIFSFSLCIVTPIFWALLGIAVSMDAWCAKSFSSAPGATSIGKAG